MGKVGRAAVVGVLFAAALAACGSGGGGTKKTLAPPPVANSQDWPRMQMTVATDGNTSMRLIGQSRTERRRDCGNDELPSSIGSSSTGDQCFDIGLGSVDAFTDFTYAIDNSQSLLWGNSKVPLVGENTVYCEIRKQGTTNKDLNSRYACRYEFTDSDRYNPKPKISVFRKPAEEVTDPQRAAQLVADRCNHDEPECSFTMPAAYQVLAAPPEKWLLYGGVFPNCDSTEPKPHTYGETQTVSWRDSIGLTFKSAAGVAKRVLDASERGPYQSPATQSFDFKESHTQDVPYKKAGAFFIQPGYEEITGDFLIADADKVYSITGVVFDFPLKDVFNPPNGKPPVKPAQVMSVLIDDAHCAAGSQQSVPLNLPAGSPPPPGATVEGPAR